MPKSNEEEAPHVKADIANNVGLKPIIGKRKPYKRKNYSNFMMTINTNERYNEDDPRLQDRAAQLENAIMEIFQDSEIANYMRIQDSWTKEFIVDDPIFKCRLELGGKAHTLHAHAFLLIAHRTKLQVYIEGVRARLCELLNLPNIYFWIKATRNSPATDIERWNQYIEKNYENAPKTTDPIDYTLQ